VKLSVSVVKPVGVCAEIGVAEKARNGVCGETVDADFWG
jgi:hypothetical protein